MGRAIPEAGHVTFGTAASSLARTRFDSGDRDRPVVGDMLQIQGTPGPQPTGKPYTITALKVNVGGQMVATTSHRGTTGIMQGGDFLFEDGHVSWYNEDKINLGSQIGAWLAFYEVQ